MEKIQLDADTLKQLYDKRRSLRLYIALCYTESQNDHINNIEEMREKFALLTAVQKRITSHLLTVGTGDEADADFVKHQQCGDKVERMIAKYKEANPDYHPKPVKIPNTGDNPLADLAELRSKMNTLEPIANEDDYNGILALQKVLQEGSYVPCEKFHQDLINRAFSLMPKRMFFAFIDTKCSREIEDLSQFLTNRLIGLLWLDSIGTTLLKLPDLCILRIFAHLPLEDLAKIHHFYKPWTGLQTRALQNRTALSLILGSGQTRNQSHFDLPHQEDLRKNDGAAMFPRIDYKWSQVEVSQLTEEIARGLISRYPNVKRLEIHQIDLADDSSEFIWILALLKKWSQKLVSLKLYSRASANDDSANFRRLMRYMKNFPGPYLKSLSLEFSNSHSFIPLPTSLDLPILSRLEVFQFSIGYGEVETFQTLIKYAGESLRQVDLNTRYMISRRDWDSFRLDPRLAAKITSIDELPHEIARRERLHCAFHSLTTVELTLFDQTTISQLTACLAPLTNLLCLRLYAHNWTDILAPSTDPITPIPSVVLVHLFFQSQNHDTLTGFELHLAFPAVQVIELNNFKVNCETCEYRLDFATGDDQLNECKRLQMKSLIKCGKLRKVYYPLSEYEVYRKVARKVEWTVEELTQEIEVKSTRGWRWMEPGVRILTAN